MSTSKSKDLEPLTSNYWRRFFRSQRTKPIPFPKDLDLTGKTAIVTGSNTGLGFEGSRQFLSFNLSHLIMAVRSAERGEAAAAKLRAQYPKATIEVWPLDMASYSSIQAFVGRVESLLTRLDIAVLNAGLSRMEYHKVPSTGHEEMVQVNYLSTMLLGVLLLPVLKTKSPAGCPGRLTIVSSALANITPLPDNKNSTILKVVDDPKLFGHSQYGLSKLLGHLFLWKLADYVSPDDVVFNLIEPGFLKGTEFGREATGALGVGMKMFQSAMGRAVPDAGTTILDATVVKGTEAGNCYLADWEIRPFPPFLYSKEGKEASDKLWEETMAEFSFANAQGILNSMKKA
ncbi:hypothetical protein ABW19_dt0208262 [Dactylella cylindrospora]|nr:hypothetical protein ABW19_dt0208262 [Dactylella cylindrospora]